MTDFPGWDDKPDPIDRPHEIWRATALVIVAGIVIATTPIDASGGWRAFTWMLLLVAVGDFARVISRRWEP